MNSPLSQRNELRLLMRLLFVCICLLAVSFPTHASAPHSACDVFATLPTHVYRFSADLNGLHGSDLFVADRSGETTIITACDYPSLGPWDMRDTNKPLNKVVVVDVESDGKEELIIGGPTGSSPLSGTITRLTGSQLESGEHVSIRPPGDVLVGETFQCLDSNNDGRADIVNYTYSYTADKSEIHWIGSDNSQGMFALPSDAVAAWLFRSGLCGTRVVLNLEFKVGGYSPTTALESIKSHLAKNSSIQLGINNHILQTTNVEELTHSEGWVIPIDNYAGYEGPFSVLSLIERAQKLTVGPHNHCGSQPLEPPNLAEDNLIQISFQPDVTNSCLQWFSVDFWLRDNFTIAAVMLNIWEP